MTSGFTPEELRLLKISDKAEGGGGRHLGPRRTWSEARIGRPPTGMLGQITEERAEAMHHAGATAGQIAAAADVSCGHVSKWRADKGLARVWKRRREA